MLVEFAKQFKNHFGFYSPKVVCELSLSMNKLSLDMVGFYESMTDYRTKHELSIVRRGESIRDFIYREYDESAVKFIERWMVGEKIDLQKETKK